MRIESNRVLSMSTSMLMTPGMAMFIVGLISRGAALETLSWHNETRKKHSCVPPCDDHNPHMAWPPCTQSPPKCTYPAQGLRRFRINKLLSEKATINQLLQAGAGMGRESDQYCVGVKLQVVSRLLRRQLGPIHTAHPLCTKDARL